MGDVYRIGVTITLNGQISAGLRAIGAELSALDAKVQALQGHLNSGFANMGAGMRAGVAAAHEHTRAIEGTARAHQLLLSSRGARAVAGVAALPSKGGTGAETLHAGGPTVSDRHRARANAESLFRRAVVPQEEKSSAVQEYKAQQQATIDKTARLQAQRLAWHERRLMFGSPTPVFRAPTTAGKR